MKKLITIFVFLIWYLCKFVYVSGSGYSGKSSAIIGLNRYVDINNEEDVGYVEQKIKDTNFSYHDIELLEIQEVCEL